MDGMSNRELMARERDDWDRRDEEQEKYGEEENE